MNLGKTSTQIAKEKAYARARYEKTRRAYKRLFGGLCGHGFKNSRFS